MLSLPSFFKDSLTLEPRHLLQGRVFGGLWFCLRRPFGLVRCSSTRAPWIRNANATGCHSFCWCQTALAVLYLKTVEHFKYDPDWQPPVGHFAIVSTLISYFPVDFHFAVSIMSLVAFQPFSAACTVCSAWTKNLVEIFGRLGWQKFTNHKQMPQPLLLVFRVVLIRQASGLGTRDARLFVEEIPNMKDHPMPTDQPILWGCAGWGSATSQPRRGSSWLRFIWSRWCKRMVESSYGKDWYYYYLF